MIQKLISQFLMQEEGFYCKSRPSLKAELMEVIVMVVNQELYYQVPELSAMPFTLILISLALISLIWSHNGVNFWTMISQQLQNFMTQKIAVLILRLTNVIIFLLQLIAFTILLESLVFHFIDQNHFVKKMEKPESTLISIPILLTHQTFMDMTMKLLNP